MKLLYLQILLYVSFISIGQNDNFDRQLFYKIGVAATLTINSEGLSSDDDSSCIVPNALFVKNTFGIAVNKRISMGLNAELDWHSKPNLLFFTIYPDIRYNIIQKDDNGFIRFGYGKMFGKGELNEGTLYKISVGSEHFHEDFERSTLFGLEFTQKSFGFKELDKLISVSIFLEIIF